LVPSQESSFQNRSRALALSACSSNPFISTRRVDSGTVAPVFLGEMERALLLQTRAGVALTQGLELEPVLAQSLRETALRRNGAGPSGLLVLRAEDAGGGTRLRLNASWRRLSCGGTRLKLPWSWEPAC
jgi:hypothetical protein